MGESSPHPPPPPGCRPGGLGRLDLLLQSMARHRKIGRVHLNPDARPPQTHTRREGGPRAHERIKDHGGCSLLHEALEQVYGLLRRVELLVEVDPVFLASAHATSPELAVMVRRHVQ